MKSARDPKNVSKKFSKLFNSPVSIRSSEIVEVKKAVVKAYKAKAFYYFYAAERAWNTYTETNNEVYYEVCHNLFNQYTNWLENLSEVEQMGNMAFVVWYNRKVYQSK